MQGNSRPFPFFLCPVIYTHEVSSSFQKIGKVPKKMSVLFVSKFLLFSDMDTRYLCRRDGCVPHSWLKSCTSASVTLCTCTCMLLTLYSHLNTYIVNCVCAVLLLLEPSLLLSINQKQRADASVELQETSAHWLYYHTWLLPAIHMHASNSSIQCSQAVGLCTQSE